jgi:tetratricopeptide (TPR) repeat protein
MGSLEGPMIAYDRAPIQPGPVDVEELHRLLIAGRPLDAFAYTSRFPPFEAWTCPRARRTAEWLCQRLGAPKRSRAIELGTYRRAPRSAIGRIVRLYLTLAERGPLEAWRALRDEKPLGDDATDQDRAELPLVEGQVLARFRDFERATAAVRRAGESGASPRRVALFEGRILMERDRYREALGTVLKARALAPDCSDVIGFMALLHSLLGDADEALAILRSGAARTQSADLARHLVLMLEERKLFDERREWIERWSERVPLLERPEDLLHLRADSALERGDLRTALELLRRDKSKLGIRLADRLASTIDDPCAKRVLLDVPFVRQHHKTCVPATLTALAGYWQMPADHLEVAEAICYDGTPSHSQRTWAETHGFVAREMTVTWEVARALLDRGVPFTVAIVEGAGAHLQAIVGYDERRGTLLIRDPFIPHRLEALAEEWLETWRATGPLGMALVPIGQEERLEGIELPDAPLCDELHRLNAALERHDRDAAQRVCDALVAAAPAHRLAVSARRALAGYDQDAEGVLACALEMAAMFPAFVVAELDALQCMRLVRSREERIGVVEELVRAHPKEHLYAEALALAIADDARQHPAAARLLRRAHRAHPDRHGPLALVAEIAWSARRFDEALSIRRFAACLGRFDETAAGAYFVTARALAREEEAFTLLEARAAELGPLAAGPIGTLFRALEAVGRTAEGLEVVDRALEREAADGQLLLLASEIRGAIGDIEAARALLAKAEGVAKRTHWLRGAAQLALRVGAFADRKEFLKELLEREPLDIGAHVSYATALAASEGVAAALAHLGEAHARMPHLRSLSHVYLEWQRGAGAAVVERAARKVLELDRVDAWVYRELANALVDQGRTEEARKTLGLAAALAPNDASLECSRALVFRREGKHDEARAALLAALELDPDRSGAIADLSSWSGGNEDREQALSAVERIVQERSVTGAGIVAWYTAARGARENALVAATLERLRLERPQLVATWTTSIAHHSLMGDHPAAIALAGDACAHFPLSSSAWTARADALLSARRGGEALAAIEQAVRVDSVSVGAISRLANALLRSGDAARARDVLVRAIGRLPASTPLRVQLAELAWGVGDRAVAFIEIEAVLALEADHDHAWSLLDEWSAAGSRGAAGGDGAVLARIESLAAERPWSAHAALNVARAKARRNDADGALAALDRATALNPRLVAAHDYRAVLLALRGQFDLAAAACAPTALAGALPRELKGRAAWVRARQGDLEGACRAIQELLGEHPDYAWGWSELARWASQRGATDQVLAAARRLVTSSPNEPACHRLLARALFGVGDRAGGKRALERAVDLAPNDQEALAALFDALLDDGDQSGAAALLPLHRATSQAAALSREVRLLARRGDADCALETLRALAVHPRADTDSIDEAHRACVLAGMADRCAPLVVDLLGDDAAHASIGEIWVRERLAENDLPGVTRMMNASDPKTVAVRAGAAAWLQLLRERGDREATLEAARLVRSRFSPCDDPLWHEVAASFLMSAHGECVTWTSDWRARPGATSVMLLTVASGLREVGREEEAYEVVQHAARLPIDGASRSHRAWLAFELAVRGERVEARRWLTEAGELARVPILETVAVLTNAVLVAQEDRRGVSSFRRARQMLTSVDAQRRFTVLSQAHRRATARVARDAGFLGTLWNERRTLGVCASVVAVVLCVVLWANVSTLPERHGSSEIPSISPMSIGLLILMARLAMRRRRGT